MKNTEIRELTTKEILEAIQEQKLKLYKLRASHTVGNLENSHLLKDTKRLIARLKTELTKRQKEQQQN